MRSFFLLLLYVSFVFLSEAARTVTLTTCTVNRVFSERLSKKYDIGEGKRFFVLVHLSIISANPKKTAYIVNFFFLARKRERTLFAINFQYFLQQTLRVHY